MKTLILMLAMACSIAAQTTVTVNPAPGSSTTISTPYSNMVVANPMSGLVDAIVKAKELQLRQQELDNQREAIRAAGQQSTQAQRPVANGQPPAVSDTTAAYIRSSVEKLRSKYPDFDSNYTTDLTEMTRLASLFWLGINDNPKAASDYMEGLYVMAIHAPFSRVATIEVGKPQALKSLIEDIDFNALPVTSKMAVMRRLDPDFAAQPVDVQLQALSMFAEEALKKAQAALRAK